MNNKYFISIITIILALASGALSTQASRTILSECVTKSDWELSLTHAINYASETQINGKVLVSRSTENFYQSLVQCIDDNNVTFTKGVYDRQLVLLPRLSMVESVTDNSGKVCAKLITKKTICSI